MHRIKTLLSAVAVVTALSASANSFAETIKVGMSAALTGPASALGNGVKDGIESYFKRVNAAGGINGNMIALTALDDGYEPDRAAPNMDQLIDQEKVLAVLGNVGTPTAIVTVPIANAKKTLLFGAYTGAGVLRKSPPDRYIINYRASYAEETAAMVKGLLASGIKAEEIAFFTQNDGYGDAGYNGGVAALKAEGFNDTDKLAHGRYPRNTTNVEQGLGTILDAEVEPKAIIMVGAYAPCAAFIRQAKQDLPDTKFLNVSFVGSIPLLKALGDKADGVIVTQVVPHYEADLPGVSDYRKDLQAYKPGAQPDFVSLEGYLLAKIFVEGLKKAPALDREGVINGLESLNQLDIGIDVPVSFSASSHQASHKVWPTVIKNGKYEILNWSEL
ncbi:ABC transporter substrate-binding protein [Shewanella sp. A3A]|uniref:ABC transporter substrate-binding protein n=1 Tax=Shewanella electrica TaxID=515560 RepID=A0ABT2FHJ5_9GAMM|nr:ABC transporter substrate-binding protein [Shewanella electrica]MCH1921268.1 ABC transporter substrate-binding protein [Shewanella ferrihydritica]MCH1923894.1 ABC transporter substrate-binding protein [Shewanella electrica]MCS4555798.1 ABC transporter substrate-binding protein [Shewanella electrica]